MKLTLIIGLIKYDFPKKQTNNFEISNKIVNVDVTSKKYPMMEWRLIKLIQNYICRV